MTKIKKIDSEIIYRKTSERVDFEVNGKKISMFFYEDTEGYDNDWTVEGREKLTDDEYEDLTNDVYEIRDMKDGEEIEYNEDGDLIKNN